MHVNINNGIWRGRKVSGTFEVTREIRKSAKGWKISVLVDNYKGLPDGELHIVLDSPEQVTLVDAPKAAPQRSDSEIMHEIGRRFELLEEMAGRAALGQIRSLIISGPAGLGKTFGVERAISQMMETDNIRHEIVKGNISAIGLYKLLWEYKDDNCVLVFDDADAVFDDEIKLNLLKTALDSTERRVISWRTESSALYDKENEEKIPNYFEYEGSIIFISNLDFERIIEKDGRMAPHFSALTSRSFYVDCGIHTQHEKILRLEQVVRKAGMLRGKVTPTQEEDIISYVKNRKDRVREISLRLVIKLSQLVNLGSNWEEVADVTVCKNG